MKTTKPRLAIGSFTLLVLAVVCANALAGEKATADLAYYAIDNLFLLAAAILVFAMQPGFALVESGLNPSKNTVHCLFKNTIDVTFGVLLYFLVG